MLVPFLLGVGTGLSLIVAIGAQNAFVLRQGILREHVLPVVLICSISDVVLQTLGVLGIGIVIERAPIVLEVVRWGGAAFLVWYAWLAARRAMNPDLLVAAEGGEGSMRRAVLSCLAITFLNPHVYLDTVVLLGSIGNAEGDPGRWWFVMGATLASFGWFFLLGYGARLLSARFATRRAWQILDWIIATVMLVIAARLGWGGLGR